MLVQKNQGPRRPYTCIMAESDSAPDVNACYLTNISKHYEDRSDMQECFEARFTSWGSAWRPA